jgi:hypothetical protein
VSLDRNGFIFLKRSAGPTPGTSLSRCAALDRIVSRLH